MTSELIKPDNTKILDYIQSALSKSDKADTTKRQYVRAIERAIEKDVNLYDSASVANYAVKLPKSSKAFLKAAIRLWSKEIELEAKGSALPENVAAIQATCYRIEALNEAITVSGSKGQKGHTWLSGDEVRALDDYCNDDTINCKRDKIIIGLMVSAGLRRDEVVELTFANIKKQPIKGRVRTVLAVSGKGAKERTIPLNDSFAETLGEWALLTGGKGKVARSLTQRGQIKDSLSGVAVYKIVNDAGRFIGRSDLAPHDLRRTFARLGYDAGISLLQISKLLGHESVDTTVIYLGLDTDLENTASDYIPFG